MRVFIHQPWWMPEGLRYRALKAEAEVVEGSINDLLWDLAIHRHALQRVVDALWELDELPRRSKLHQLFYPMLRNYGFRAHVARNIYDSALAIVKSARSNGSNKPRVRKFTARLDNYDAKVELDKGVVKVILRDKWYVLRLKHRREYIERFIGLRWKEVHVKYEGKRLFVSIVFEVRYEPYAPKGFMAVDVNLRMITTFNGTEVRRFRTRLIDALSKRARVEELQKKYPKRWRFNERILNRIKALHRRARNIVIDSSWKLAREIVTRAYKHGHAIILENLEHLRDSINEKNNDIRWKLTLFAYRKLQHAIIAKAIEHNVPVIIVDPRNTSTTCPRCGSRLTYIHRLAFCRNCGFIGDRDVVGAMNIWLRAVQACAGLPGSTQSASPMNNETRQSRGTKNEEMKKTNRPKPPISLIMLFAGPLYGVLMSTIGYRRVLVVTSGMATIGGLLMAATVYVHELMVTILVMIFSMIGIAGMTVTRITLLISSTSRERMATMTGTNTAMRLMGNTLGPVIAGSLETTYKTPILAYYLNGMPIFYEVPGREAFVLSFMIAAATAFIVMVMSTKVTK